MTYHIVGAKSGQAILHPRDIRCYLNTANDIAESTTGADSITQTAVMPSALQAVAMATGDARKPYLNTRPVMRVPTLSMLGNIAIRAVFFRVF